MTRTRLSRDNTPFHFVGLDWKELRTIENGFYWEGSFKWISIRFEWPGTKWAYWTEGWNLWFIATVSLIAPFGRALSIRTLRNLIWDLESSFRNEKLIILTTWITISVSLREEIAERQFQINHRFSWSEFIDLPPSTFELWIALFWK